jgi:hypothetical protein
MDVSLIVIGAATLLSGIHGNNGSHTPDAIKKAVDMAVAIAEAAEAVVNPQQPKPPQP